MPCSFSSYKPSDSIYLLSHYSSPTLISIGRVAELVYAYASEAYLVRVEGSSPSSPTMRIDGRKIAEEISEELKKEVEKRGKILRLGIIYAGSNKAIESFISRKEKFAKNIDIKTKLFRFGEDISTEILKNSVQEILNDDFVGGIIVQLPLPKHIPPEEILSLIPPEKDPDLLSPASIEKFEQGESEILPPTLGAIVEIITRNKVLFENKKTVVLGRGRLVGKPVATWLRRHGVSPKVLGRDTGEKEKDIAKADIIISGIGVPKFIRPEMIRNGVVLIDAGTSEEGGVLSGDIDPACESKASLFTPTPGGVGPITVAILFKNLLSLKSQKLTSSTA